MRGWSLVDEFLAEAAAGSHERVALVTGTRRLTYGQLEESAERFAAGLQAAGLQRSDRVVIHLENGPEAVIALFGTLKAGGVFVPVNPTVKEDKLTYILNDCSASVLVTDERNRATALAALGGAPSLRLVALAGVTEPDSYVEPLHRFRQVTSFGALAETPSDLNSVRPGIDLDLAALVYTSGSTGRPKGVMLSHANIVSAATSIDAYLENTASDVILDVLPLSFDYGLYQIFLAFGASARLVLERSFAYPSLLLELLARERVTALPLVPMMAALLLKHDLKAYDLSALRYITNTGAALPSSHIAALRERLPHVRLFSMYGLTECKRVSYLPPEEIDSRPTSVGKPMDDVEVYLLDDTGARRETGVGELVVRGSNVMLGYWGASDDTARVLQPGAFPGELVLRTGDIFRIDADGYMYFQSRTDDVIKTRGQKVSPREIENVLHTYPGVSQAIVVGEPDPVLGEAVKAYVTLEPTSTATAQDILRHCARHLEDLLVPKAVEIVDQLPRTLTGKIARTPLKASGVN